MTIRFLKGISTRTELKQAYRRLSKKLHPDVGGNHEDMVQLNLEFEYLFSRVSTTKQEKASPETASQYMEVVEKINFLPGIKIELCGTWLWVTGDTKPVKDQLKAAGFKFSGKKVAWYWKAGTYRKFGRKVLSLDEIRSYYGSQEIETEKRAAIS